MNRIITIEEEVPNVHKMVIDAPDVAKKCKPGHFAIVIPDEQSERIPLSIADWDEDAGTVTIYFLEVGVSTMKLARKVAGDEIDMMAPLGRESEIDNYGTVVVCGGCYGVGAIYPIVKALKEAGNTVVTIIEARAKYLLYNEEVLARDSDEIYTATSDGSHGTKGKAQTVMKDLVDGGRHFDRAYIMGCTFMMMRNARMAKELGIPSKVYLNPLMVDATGMCGVCRCDVGGETKFACVDGPEFDGADVDWEQLFKRSAQYVPHQTLAYQHKKCDIDHCGGV